MSLSVVIPCSTLDASLPRLLESLLVQEQAIEEIVVVSSEQSTAIDGTLKKAKKRFPGSLIDCRHPEGAGAVERWNLGIARATGDWISLLTPQTTVRPAFARVLASSAERSPDASVLRAGWTRARPRGGPAEQHTLLSVRTITHPGEALYEQRFGPTAATSAAAIRRETWERMGGLPAEIALLGDWIGDWALWLTAGALGDTVRSPEILADIHLTSKTTSKADEVRELYLIYRDILPRAAACAQLADASWIAAASRKRFRDVAIAASNDLHPAQTQERAEIAAALEPWAAAVEQESLLNRLRSGERIRSFTLGQKMKPALRRVVAAVR